MADTTALKNRIRAAIKANDNQEITGPVLQQSLLDIIDELNSGTEAEALTRSSADNALQQNITAEKNRAEGVESTLQQNITAEKNRAEGVESTLQQNITAEKNRAEGAEQNIQDRINDICASGYLYAGIATPSGIPNLPEDENVQIFYIAKTAGTYANYGNIIIPNNSIYFILYNGTWNFDLVVGINDEPTAESDNLVKSSGVYDFVLDKTLTVVNVSELDYFKEATLRNASNTQKYTLASNNKNVGTLQIISDSLGHVVTQIITTHYLYNNANGTIDWTQHLDGNVVEVYRSVKVHGGTLPDDNWTRWNYVNNEILSALQAGIDGVIFDVSEHNGGTTFASLDAILNSQSLSTLIPTGVRSGGMSIKFIQSPDNKYVQYRYMETDATTVATFINVANWQGVDDEPIAGSSNLVKSGGVHSKLATIEEELGIPVKTEITENVSVTWAGTGLICARTSGDGLEGTAKTWEDCQYSDFILIDKYTTLTYMRMVSTSAQSNILAGLCFYSEANESAVLVGNSIPYIGNAAERGYENQTIIVPQNAKYIRFSCYDEYVGIFTCEGKYADYIYSDGLGKKVSDLQEEADALQQSISAEVLRSTGKDTQLEGSVHDLQTNVGEYTVEEITTPINVGVWRDNYAINATTIPEHDIYLGEGRADNNNSATDFVDISSRPSNQLQYTNVLSTSAQSNIAFGLCFYDSQKVAISGVLYEGDASEFSYKLIKVDIPVNAKYVRFSFRTNLLSNFSAAFVSETRVYTNGLGKQVDNLSEEVEDIKNTIAPPAEIRLAPVLCRRRFYKAMTEWCKNHGIDDAIIEGAGGFGAGGEVENEVLGHGFANLSVADMAKILYTAYNYPEIENVMAETKHIAYTKGNERTILLESSWMNTNNAKPLTDYYKVMFGKTGGGTASFAGEQIMPENSYCLSAICYHEDFDDCLVIGVVRVKSNSAAKFPVFKQLMDLAKKIINNDDSASDIATALTNNTDLGHAIAIKLPFGNPRAYHNVDFDSNNLSYVIYKKEPQNPQGKLFYPMSMIKVLTAMVVLDYTKDLDVFLTITQEDRDSATSNSSAYSLFEGGEKITIRDLLYASLLPSSNVANYVLARYVGQFLLETYDTNGFIPNN